MGIRRTVTALVSMSALALLTVPLAMPSVAAPASATSTVHWYEGKSGTVQWAIGAEFLQELDTAGASLTFCRAAKVAVDKGSGITIVTMPVHGNSAIQLNGRQSGVDAASDCLVTITGNGTSVALTTMYFGVSSASTSGISALIADEYTELGSGARKKLPKAATRNTIRVDSPVIVTESSFSDLLRGQTDASTGTNTGPVPTMSTDAVNLGAFRLSLKVKTSSEPSAGNEEG